MDKRIQSAWGPTQAIDGVADYRQDEQFHALGTNVQLSIFGANQRQWLTKAHELVINYEDQLTVNRNTSEVMAINQAAGKYPIQVSDSTYRLIELGVKASLEKSGFNIAIGPLVKSWQIGFADAHRPSPTDIDAALALIDPQKIHLDAGNRTVYLSQVGMKLDLGAIAKGYIADRIKDLWMAVGISAGLINLGGNLLFVGASPHTTDRAWRIGVQNPWASRGEPLATVNLPACSAVTSGIYERHLTVGQHDYHHILDSQTGYPFETDLAGVTVFSRHSIIGEVESTRLFFAGKAPQNWLQEHPDCLGAIFVNQQHQVEIVGLDPAIVKLNQTDSQ
ncbi:FAD:protein FMN transferase [Furfurilactobacillus curtus]|uniref:FAD:protein FMN transferase n=1 Tax=Furfurilactobacillus curtus TaxID=1746200 RepID=A0ABQ5JP27_9LACO